MFSDYLAYSTQTTPHSQAQSQFDDLWKADVEVSVNDLLFSSPIIEHNSFNYFTYDLDCDYENNLHTIPSSSASPSNSAISTNQLYCHNTPSTPSLVPSSPISPVASIYSPYQPQDQYEQYNSLCMAQSGAPLSVYEIDTSPYSLKLPTSPVFDQAPYVSHYAGYSEPTNVADYVTDVKVDCDYDVDVEIEDPKDQDFSPPPSPTPGRNARIQLPPRLAQLPSSPVSDISRTNITLPQVSTAPVIPTQLNQVSQEDFDANPALVLDEYPNADKPSTTYAQLLTVAIKRAPKQKLLLDQIYDIFICKYRSFKSQKDSKGWQNSVRHNLSLYACFYQEERLVGEKGRGKYWLVEYVLTFMRGWKANEK